MRLRLKYGCIGLGVGIVPGVLLGAWVIFGIPGDWILFAAIVTLCMLSCASIGLLFPERAESIFEGMFAKH